jgi:hypothetical protein
MYAGSAVLLLLLAAGCAQKLDTPASDSQNAARQPPVIQSDDPATQPASTPTEPVPQPVAEPTPSAAAEPVAKPAAPSPQEPVTTAPTPPPVAKPSVPVSPEPVAQPKPSAPSSPAPKPAAPSPSQPQPAAPAAPSAPKPSPAAPTTKSQSPATNIPAATSTLDLDALKEEVRSTSAIGLFTKITLKNQVDDLLDDFRDYHKGKSKLTKTDLRRAYDLLLMKVLSLLQDKDPRLASSIVASREVIWGLLEDPKKFATLSA